MEGKIIANTMANLEKKDEALNLIKEYIGQGGLVAFEHGFRRPGFKQEGYKYTYHMVSDKIVYCKKHFVDGSARTCNLYLSTLSASTLKSIYNIFSNTKNIVRKRLKRAEKPTL